MDYEKIVSRLKERHFAAYFVNSKEEAKSLALSLMARGSSISLGGSMTINEIGILPYLSDYLLIDRNKGDNPLEKEKNMKDAQFTDYFLSSVNAMTEDGLILQIDGRGNRVSSIIYGPKNVILFVGKNKIVKNLEEGIERARNVAAPLNAKRLNRKTPCVIANKCLDCLSPETICSTFVVLRESNTKDRIKVIIIDEDLGY